MANRDRMHERHHIPAPTSGNTQRASGVTVTDSGAFLDGFKERAHELFLTQPGLPGHATQVQQELDRLNNSNMGKDEKIRTFDQACDQIKKAAEHATFDFGPLRFVLKSVNRVNEIERRRGKAWCNVYASWPPPVDRGW